MRFDKVISLVVGITVILFFGCAKAPNYSNIPEINFISMSKNEVIQFKDTLNITIGFTDGDGDIGSDTTINLILTDSRDGSQENKYIIPKIPPLGAKNGISGEISFPITQTCCIFPDGAIPCTPNTKYPKDSLSFKIQIKDAAGNLSNQVETPRIYLKCN